MYSVILFILILTFSLFLKTLGVNDEILALFFVSLTSLLIIFYILKSDTNKSIKLILLLGFILRIICMLIDLYAFRVPHAGSDDNGFYFFSVAIYNGQYSLFDNIYGGMYTKFLSLVYHFVGCDRMVAQFISVLLSMISLFYFVKILNKLNLNNKTKSFGVAVMALLPNLIFLNSISRRDTIITMLTIMSMEKILIWYNSQKVKYAIYASFLIFLASLFHSAMIFVIPIYLIYAFLYNKNKDKVDLGGQKLIKFIIIIIIISLLGFYFIANFNTKFTDFTKGNIFETLYDTVNDIRGGSAYLTNITISNFYQFIMFSPIKFIYFLFSPMPWDWRGVSDISTFLLDSIMYLYLFIIVLKNKKNKISKLYFLCFLVVTLIFSIGTFAAGTAVRHRYNILPFLLITACYTLDQLENIKKGRKI